jgi:carbohydrate diacid regulator
MAAVVEQFERAAEAVTRQIAELLGARVAVVDRRGVVVAGSAPGTVGLPFDGRHGDPDTAYLRLPIRLDAQDGEVIVTEPTHGEHVPPRLAQALVELIINQTTVVARLPNQHELKNTFIHDLLRGASGDEADVLRKGQILGMDFTPPRAVILVDAAAYILAPTATGALDEARVRRRAQLVIASIVGFFNLRDDTICAYIGDGEVAVLKASGTQDLAPWSDHEEPDGLAGSSWANLTLLKRAGASLVARLRRDTGAAINIGLGRYHPGIPGLARSYEDARAALSLGRRFHGQNGMHCLDALGIAAFVGVSDERTKIDLATHLLSPLDQEPDLLRSLDEYFAHDCGPSASAHALAIHRNTLGYRLDKIALLTGLDPRRFDDAVQIRLSLLLRSLNHTDH